ncbi:MAG: glycosyltransferase family 2 protein [Acidimicrobiia bacterium]|nr:glycosyltransferase family 2 protein [Acidimicrobiia bacterium]
MASSRCLSVVIPAHNEAAVIERCLRSLAVGAEEGLQLEVVVVANGCTDDTADRARRAMPSARVIELERPSKSEALNAGDDICVALTRAYLDADVCVDHPALAAVATALDDGGALCAAPRMAVELGDRPWYVRSFYRAFVALPYVSDGLVGNGFYAISAEGRQRFDRFPDVTADDLFIRNLFAEHERAVVDDHHFWVHPPRRLAGLIAIRRRVYRGNEEYEEAGYRSAAARTRSVSTLARVGLRHPLGIVVYLAVNLYARATWRRHTVGWERDDSGRTP